MTPTSCVVRMVRQSGRPRPFLGPSHAEILSASCPLHPLVQPRHVGHGFWIDVDHPEDALARVREEKTRLEEAGQQRSRKYVTALINIALIHYSRGDFTLARECAIFAHGRVVGTRGPRHTLAYTSAKVCQRCCDAMHNDLKAFMDEREQLSHTDADAALNRVAPRSALAALQSSQAVLQRLKGESAQYAREAARIRWQNPYFHGREPLRWEDSPGEAAEAEEGTHEGSDSGEAAEATESKSKSRCRRSGGRVRLRVKAAGGPRGTQRERPATWKQTAYDHFRKHARGFTETGVASIRQAGSDDSPIHPSSSPSPRANEDNDAAVTKRRRTYFEERRRQQRETLADDWCRRRGYESMDEFDEFKNVRDSDVQMKDGRPRKWLVREGGQYRMFRDYYVEGRDRMDAPIR